MQRSIIIALAAVTFSWGSASAGYIDELTLDDVNGPRISADFRDGVIAGIFHSLTASKAITCTFMSPRRLASDLQAALRAKEIDGHWTVYHSTLYVLVRAGCKATAEKPDA